MADIVTIAGSPSSTSRSTATLAFIHGVLQERGLTTDSISIRDLDPYDLLHANFNSPSLHASIEKIARACAVIVATPIYKAAYSGVLKVYLDLLPANALCDKIVLPLATGGTLAHLLALDYALKPVLLPSADGTSYRGFIWSIRRSFTRPVRPSPLSKRLKVAC